MRKKQSPYDNIQTAFLGDEYREQYNQRGDEQVASLPKKILTNFLASLCIHKNINIDIYKVPNILTKNKKKLDYKVTILVEYAYVYMSNM